MASVHLRYFPGAPSISTGSYASKASWHKRKMKKEYNFLTFQRPSLNHDMFEGGSTHREGNKKYVVKITSRQSFESGNEPQPFDLKSNLDCVKNFLDAFCRFSRPLAIFNTALSTISVSLLAVEKLSDISPLLFIGLLENVVAALLMHIHAVGVNQLTDVEIDKINKPDLPLASGEYSFRTGVIITTSSLILSFCFSWIVGSWPLFWTLFGLFVFSTAYSINLPLLRWKSSGVLAAVFMVATKAIISQLGFFLHMQMHVYKRPIVISKPLIFAVAFMSLFFLAAALLKDIPDTEGDRKHGIHSFSVLFGPKPVLWTSIFLLGIDYVFALFVGATSPYLWSKIITGLGHAILASCLWNHAKSIDIRSNTSTSSFYSLIWKLVCAEYLLIPFVR